MRIDEQLVQIGHQHPAALGIAVEDVPTPGDLVVLVVRAARHEQRHIGLGAEEIEGAVGRAVVQNEKMRDAHRAVMPQEIGDALRPVMRQSHAQYARLRDAALRDDVHAQHRHSPSMPHALLPKHALRPNRSLAHETANAYVSRSSRKAAPAAFPKQEFFPKMAAGFGIRTY